MTRVKFKKRLQGLVSDFKPQRRPMRIGSGYVDFINFSDAVDFQGFLRKIGENATIQIKLK